MLVRAASKATSILNSSWASQQHRRVYVLLEVHFLPQDITVVVTCQNYCLGCWASSGAPSNAFHSPPLAQERSVALLFVPPAYVGCVAEGLELSCEVCASWQRPVQPSLEVFQEAGIGPHEAISKPPVVQARDPRHARTLRVPILSVVCIKKVFLS